MGKVITRELGVRHGAQSGTIVARFHQVNTTLPVDGYFFIADQPYRIVDIRYRYSVAGTDAGAVTLQLRKVPSGTAIGSGTAVGATGNLKATADTSYTITLPTVDATLELTTGDALAVDFTGVLTSLAGLVVEVVLMALPSQLYTRHA